MIDGMASIQRRSAVDTGRYIAAWMIGVNNAPGYKPPDKGKPKGHAHGTDLYGIPAVPSISFDIARDRALYLVNNVEYAQYVEARYGDAAATAQWMRKVLRNAT
jgi:hypothetical protein